jgi:hypothetical protein
MSKPSKSKKPRSSKKPKNSGSSSGSFDAWDDIFGEPSGYDAEIQSVFERYEAKALA